LTGAGLDVEVLEIARIDAALDRMREALVSVTQLLRQP
jgi:hypothetical protein